MEKSMYKSAREAAAKIEPMGMQWRLFFGDACDREGLRRFAESLDAEDPLTEQEDCYYVACEDGALGLTIDGGANVMPLATLEVAAPEEERMEIAETPWAVIKGEMREMWHGLRKLLTFKGIMKKLLITAATMLVIWIGTSIWEYVCERRGDEAPLAVRILAYLSFANGGVSTNPLYLIGGMLGKTFVLGTVFAFVLGGFKKVGKGVREFFGACRSLKGDLPASRFLAGIGAACILYNFFVGKATMALTMAGVAGVLSMLWALGGGISFIRRMAVALTAHVNRQSRVHYVNWDNASVVLSGMAAGFAVSIALSYFEGFAPYLAGAGMLLAAWILRLIKPIDGRAKKAPAAAALLIALLMLPVMAHAKEWRMERIKSEVKEYVDPDPSVADLANSYEIVSLSPDRHEIVDKIRNEKIVYTCTPPPGAIRSGDEFKMKYTRSHPENYINSARYFGTRTGFSYLPDNYNPDTRKYNYNYNIFLDGAPTQPQGSNWTQKEETWTADKDWWYSVFNLSTLDSERFDLPDGAEVTIYFHSPRAETKWVYKCRVDGEEPEEEEEAIVVPPIEEEEPDIPDDELIKLIIAILVSTGGAGGAILIAIIKALGAGNGEEKGNGGGGAPRPSDPYIKRNPDGTIEYTNPITGETDTRSAEEEEALREQIEVVLRNPDYYGEAYKKHNEWKEEQHKQLLEEIKRRNEEYARNPPKPKLTPEAQKKIDDMIIDLRYKYHIMDDDPGNAKLRKAIEDENREQMAEHWKNLSDSYYAEARYHNTKFAKDYCDVVMDILAVAGGDTGAKVRDGYRAMAEWYGALYEGVAMKKSFKEIVGAGLTRSIITYTQYNSKGVAHDVVCVFGEGARDFTNALFAGKSPAEAAREGAKGMVRGMENAIIDRFTAGLGKQGEKLILNLQDVDIPVNLEIADKVNNAIATFFDDIGKWWSDGVLSD